MTKVLGRTGIARIIYIVAGFLVLGIGVGGVWWPTARELDAIHTDAAQLYEQANQLDAAVSQMVAIRGARNRVAADIRTVGGVRASGAVTAAALALLHRESAAYRIDVRSIVPESEPNAVPGKPPKKNAFIEPLPVSITLRGSFRAIVALVSDLPRHDVLVELNGIHLTALPSTAGTVTLEATLQATIYRLRHLPASEVTDVRTF